MYVVLWHSLSLNTSEGASISSVSKISSNSPLRIRLEEAGLRRQVYDGGGGVEIKDHAGHEIIHLQKQAFNVNEHSSPACNFQYIGAKTRNLKRVKWQDPNIFHAADI